MKREEAESLFTLAGMKPETMWELPNGYWPRHANYQEIRDANPWWLVRTEFGLIKIGWRKKVVQIDWEDTKSRFMLTDDDVTKDESMVHAWTIPKALEYLIAFRTMATKQEAEVKALMSNAKDFS